MRWHGRRVAVYAYTQPVDMRKGFDGLSALITGRLQRDPLTGDVYIFVSRNRIRAKVLHWDGTGLCIYDPMRSAWSMPGAPSSALNRI